MCPTRIDGEEALIAHLITIAECQKRQREHFHKCPTCAHCNARLGSEATRAPGESAVRPPAS